MRSLLEGSVDMPIMLEQCCPGALRICPYSAGLHKKSQGNPLGSTEGCNNHMSNNRLPNTPRLWLPRAQWPNESTRNNAGYQATPSGTTQCKVCNASVAALSSWASWCAAAAGCANTRQYRPQAVRKGRPFVRKCGSRMVGPPWGCHHPSSRNGGRPQDMDETTPCR